MVVALTIAACGGGDRTSSGAGGSASGGGPRGGDEGAGAQTGDAGEDGAYGGDDSTGGELGDVCVPNETQLCNGPGACQGAQACRADGSGWEPCDCGGGVGGSAGATSGTRSGGAPAGGADSGGAPAGGTDSGGAPAGGTDSGGTVSGGTDSGGAPAGGTDSGGTLTGGAGGAPTTGGEGGAVAPPTGGTGGGVSLTCGDGVVDAAEACDDGNADSSDGCTPFCRLEPLCDDSGCTSTCGDGLPLGAEQCDDGNRADGDGCSATCTVEPGYQCAQPPLGDRIVVPVVYRDFLASHPDFEPGATGCEEVSPGMVALALDTEGKPVLGVGASPSGLCNYVNSADSFREWYRDVPGANATSVSALTLYANGSGGYVNRSGPNGEQFLEYSDPFDCYCGSIGQETWDADGTPIPCTQCISDEPETPECDNPQENDCSPGGACEGYECVEQSSYWAAMTVVDQHDGDPYFFPVDDATFTPSTERAIAMLPPAYGGAWEEEPSGVEHNFHFTSEVRFWFVYQAGAEQILSFTGDDDVWVFINRRLAVDLGGIHTPLDGSVNLDLMAGDFALVDGGLYEIVVFQAERQTYGSSYRLTLGGINPAPSQCVPS